MAYQGVTLLLAAAIGIAFAAYQYYTQRSTENQNQPHPHHSHQRSYCQPRRSRRRSEADVCCVCLDFITSGRKTLSCEHDFHIECINDWVKINKTCPVCRTPV